jgi:[acyl-carrier-protein] S-malonyltransferase
LKEEDSCQTLSSLQMASLGLLAGMLGIADYIVSNRGVPESVGGISLGELVALCFSSAISLKDATSIILCEKDLPLDCSAEPEGVGFVFIPRESDSNTFEHLGGIYVAVDYGEIQGGTGNLLMLSGLRENLEKSSETSPWEIDILPEELCDTAYHSELRNPASRKVAELLESIKLSNCDYPVNTCFKDLRRLRTPEDVKQALIKNVVEPLFVSQLIEQQKNDDLAEMVCIGPFLRSLDLNLGLPAEYFDEKWVSNFYGGKK